MPNMGFKRDNHAGNMIINFNVEYQEKLTDEQVEKLRSILQLINFIDNKQYKEYLWLYIGRKRGYLARLAHQVRAFAL